MKRVIKSSTDKAGARKELAQLVRDLAWEGVSEHTMLTAFLDNLDPEVSVQVLTQLAEECDIDLEEIHR